MTKKDRYHKKYWRVSFSIPGGDHWLLTDEKLKTRHEAVKRVAEKVGYPDDIDRIDKMLKDDECYVGSEKTSVRYSICHVSAADLED